MPVPVRIVKVLAGGALVEFTDGSTRLVVNETVDAWKRFGLAINEGTRLNPDEVALYQRIVEQFPHYSGLPEEEVAQEETVPEVIEEVPEAAIVPEVTAESELRRGHFGTGWLPDLGHNAQVLLKRELERIRKKWGTDVPPETWIEILDEDPIEAIAADVSVPEIVLPKVSVIDLADTKDLPNTIKTAQSIGSLFYKGADGKKKLAIYKSQLETFKESLSYEKGKGSTLSQAREWMEAQQGAGNEIDFDNIGGGPRFILGKDWDTLIDATTLPDADAATVEDLEKELGAIDKERLALDAELGEFPARYPSLDELVTQPETVVPREYADAILPSEMAPIETILPYGVPSAQDEGMAEGYMTMVDNFSDMPKDIVKTYKDRLGRDREAKEIPWETRYPLGPQQRDDSAGLADDQWIDPHPLANNVTLGEYYKIPPHLRHKIYKPPESRWDASRSAGSVWDRERRADIEGRGMVDEFGEIQKQAEQDAIEKAALDEWWAQARAETYQDELGEYDQYGTLSGMQEGIGMTQGIPDPLQGDVLNQRWMGLDEPAPYDVGYFEDAVVPEDYWLDKSETPFLPIFDERAGYGVGGDVQEFMYNGERWYLTKRGHYAKDYKRSELVTPWQSLPPDFF